MFSLSILCGFYVVRILAFSYLSDANTYLDRYLSMMRCAWAAIIEHVLSCWNR